MKYGLNILLSLMVLCFAVGCQSDPNKVDGGYKESEAETAFKTNFDDVAIVQNGEIYSSFDKSSEQIITDSSRANFMVADIDFNRYHHFAIEGECIEGDYVSVAIDAEGNNVLSDGVYEMRVTKVSDDGTKVWLWNNEAGLGLIFEFPPVGE